MPVPLKLIIQHDKRLEIQNNKLNELAISRFTLQINRGSNRSSKKGESAKRGDASVPCGPQVDLVAIRIERSNILRSHKQT